MGSTPSAGGLGNFQVLFFLTRELNIYLYENIKGDDKHVFGNIAIVDLCVVLDRIFRYKNYTNT